jgi:hypothetical protein
LRQLRVRVKTGIMHTSEISKKLAAILDDVSGVKQRINSPNSREELRAKIKFLEEKLRVLEYSKKQYEEHLEDINRKDHKP